MLSWPRDALVNAAIDALRSGRKSGRAMSAFAMPIELQFESACQSLIDGVADRTIYRSIAKELEKLQVAERPFYTWMHAVRKSYWKLNQQRAASVCQYAVLMETSDGSLLTQNLVVNHLISKLLQASLSDQDGFNELSVMDKNAIARLAEQLNNAAKLQSDAELQQVQMVKLMAGIRKLESADFDARKGGDPSKALREFLALVNREDIATLVNKGKAA